MSTWTEELKTEVIARYQEIMKNDFENDEDRAAHSVEVVSQLAEDFGKTNNGVRIILIKAGVYIKKSPTAKSSTKASGGAKRLNKAEAQQGLRSAIATVDADLVNDEIIEKLTGKAAQYLTEVMHRIISVGE